MNAYNLEVNVQSELINYSNKLEADLSFSFAQQVPLKVLRCICMSLTQTVNVLNEEVQCYKSDWDCTLPYSK